MGLQYYDAGSVLIENDVNNLAGSRLSLGFISLEIKAQSSHQLVLPGNGIIVLPYIICIYDIDICYGVLICPG